MNLSRQTAFDGSVDLWHFDLSGDEPCRSAEESLDPVEADRARRSASAQDRARYVAGRSRLRRILGQYVGEPAAELVIRYGQHGKPYLPRHPRLGFNLAHSGDRAVLAVMSAARVGVDIEDTARSRRDTAIARRFFAFEENEWLLRGTPHERCERFYRIWTCREAFGKALGVGLALERDTHAFAFEGDGAARVLRTSVPGERCEAWKLDTRIIDGFVLSVCAELG